MKNDAFDLMIIFWKLLIYWKMTLSIYRNSIYWSFPKCDVCNATPHRSCLRWNVRDIMSAMEMFAMQYLLNFSLDILWWYFTPCFFIFIFHKMFLLFFLSDYFHFDSEANSSFEMSNCFFLFSVFLLGHL